MSVRHGFLFAVAVVLSAGCASTAKLERATESRTAALDDWSNVEKLRLGTAVRVTERSGDRSYGRVMVVTNLKLTLELVDGSKSIERGEIVLIERFPTQFPKSFGNAAVGAGAALALSSSATPDTYRSTVAVGQETLDKGKAPTQNGYYVDALELVGRGIEMVHRGIESSRTTVVVYRR